MDLDILLLRGTALASVCWVLRIQLPTAVALDLVIGLVGSIRALIGVLLVRRIVLGVRHATFVPRVWLVSRLRMPVAPTNSRTDWNVVP